jgi:hypothetical protein
MRCSNHGRLRQQVRFLRRQFLQDGAPPFSDVLSAEIISQALAAAGVVWKDRIYPPLVTLWVFLGQVLSQDHSCRAAVAHRSPTCRWPGRMFRGHGRLLPSQKTSAGEVLFHGGLFGGT